MDGWDEGCLVAIGAVLVLCLIVGAVAHDQGHKQGVRDHAAGRYVVVPMPDGSQQVCEVKEARK